MNFLEKHTSLIFLSILTISLGFNIFNIIEEHKLRKSKLDELKKEK